MKILLSGYLGHMGKEVINLVNSGYLDAEIVAGYDINAEENDKLVKSSFEKIDEKVDCIIDFSNHLGTKQLVDYAISKKIPLVVATTGQTDEEKNMIYEASKSIPVFFAANFSVGIAVLIELAKKTAAAFPDADIEIVEKHHVRKLDAPSGTAIAIADAIKTVRPLSFNKLGRSGYGKREKNEIGIHALRLGNVVGEHEVIVATPNQTITLKHEAHSRALFAEGALSAAKYLINKPVGLYDMKSMISED